MSNSQENRCTSYTRHNCEAAVEHWLQEEVTLVYDAMKANPGRAISADDVFAKIRKRHAEKLTALK